MTEADPRSITRSASARRTTPNAPPDEFLGYVPRVPQGPSFRDLIERAVGWSRR